jgi:hypothetical protein
VKPLLSDSDRLLEPHREFCTSLRFWTRLLFCEQLSPHQIHRLAYREIETQIDRALWAPPPQSPGPPCPCAVFALAPFVDSVLAQQHDHAHKQPDRVLFEWCRRTWLFS